MEVWLPDVSSSSGQAVQEVKPLLGLEDEGKAILRNVGSYSSNDTASHPRRLESSAKPL